MALPFQRLVRVSHGILARELNDRVKLAVTTTGICATIASG
jgi:hypothetical protein